MIRYSKTFIFADAHVQLQKLSQNYLKKLIQSKQYLICHKNRRNSETFELMPEISGKYSSLKILDCRSEKPQLMLKFHSAFAVIFFSKICNSNCTNTKVLINYCHLIMKKGSFLLNGGWTWKRMLTNG